MKKAFFIADLHLGAGYRDNNREIEKKAVAFLNDIKDEASEIYLLGDIFDYWFEYKHVVPRGNVRFLGKLAELADEGIKITWIIGNHDIWIFDYLPVELGISVFDGILNTEIKGLPFCLQHGDAIGGSKKFRFLRRLFRNKFCQKMYSGIHPRWTVGFALSCSKRSRLNGLKFNENIDLKILKKWEEWCVSEISNGNKAKYFIFGHIHGYHRVDLPDERVMIVLPAWTKNGTYGVFDGKSYVLQHIW